jgi:hypothetical protein
MAKNSRADFLVDGSKLSAAYLANVAELPGLDALHREFSTLLTELENLGILQDAQTAAVQQTAKEIGERLTRGRLLVTRLRNGVKLHLGTRTERVIEFGIRPFRKAARPPKVIEVQVPVTKPISKPITKEAAAEPAP